MIVVEQKDLEDLVKKMIQAVGSEELEAKVVAQSPAILKLPSLRGVSCAVHSLFESSAHALPRAVDARTLDGEIDE